MVALSGGDLGGNEVDGEGWLVGDTKVIGGHLYRRVDETQAVYVGEQ